MRLKPVGSAGAVMSPCEGAPLPLLLHPVFFFLLLLSISCLTGSILHPAPINTVITHTHTHRCIPALVPAWLEGSSAAPVWKHSDDDDDDDPDPFSPPPPPSSPRLLLPFLFSFLLPS